VRTPFTVSSPTAVTPSISSSVLTCLTGSTSFTCCSRPIPDANAEERSIFIQRIPSLLSRCASGVSIYITESIKRMVVASPATSMTIS